MKKLMIILLVVAGAPLHTLQVTQKKLDGLRYDHARLIEREGVTQLIASAGRNSEEANRQYSLASLSSTIGEDGKMAAIFTPLAKNDLEGSRIKDMSIFNEKFPVVAVTGENKNKVFMLADAAGENLITSHVLKDADGSEVNKGIVAVAAGKEYVFALVSQKDKAFDIAGSTARGVAVLKKHSNSSDGEVTEKLRQLDANNIKTAIDSDEGAGARAARVTATLPPEVIGFADAAGPDAMHEALIGSSASMWWDEELQRLYIGFADARRDDPTKRGAVLGVAMGFFDQTANDGNGAAFRMSPIIPNPEKAMFYQDNEVARGHAAAVDIAHEIVEIAQKKYDKVVADSVKHALDGAPAGHADGALFRERRDALRQPLKTAAARDFFDHTVDGMTWSQAAVNPDTYKAYQVLQGNADQDLARVKVRAFGGNLHGINVPNAVAPLKESQALIPYNRLKAQEAALGDEYINGLSSVFGYYYDGTTPRRTDNDVQIARHSGFDDVSLTVRKVRVMHTSTGKSYLIFNSVVASNPMAMDNVMLAEAEDWIYALPLSDQDQTGEPGMKGSVVRVDRNTGLPDLTPDKKFQTPTTFYNVPRSEHQPVRVAGVHPLVAGGWVQELFVVGDSVYMGLTGPNSKNRGLYKSTALFNADGFIVAWTPAQRVGGVVTNIRSAFLDNKTGNFYAITDIGNKGGITSWGVGNPDQHGQQRDKDGKITQDGTQWLLSTVLEKSLPAAQGGVHHYVTFDRFSPGFVAGKFAMSVALGSNKVVLVETGKVTTAGFTPTEKFEVGSTVREISDQPLQAIAPLTSAAMTVEGDNAVLIVSGFGGMAKIAFGRALSTLDAGWAAPAVTRFVPVLNTPVFGVARSRVGGNERVTALTQTHMNTYDPAGALVAGHAAPLVDGSNLIVLRSNVNNDQSYALAATENGIHVSEDMQVFQQRAGAPGRILHMQYLSTMQDNRHSLPGNLYVLSYAQRFIEPGDQQEDDELQREQREEQTAQIYRYYVHWDAGHVAIDPIDRVDGAVVPYVQFDDLRSIIAVDGSLLLHALPKDVSATDFVRSLPLTKRAASEQMLEHEYMLFEDLDIDAGASSNIGVPVRDPSSGAWVIPGDWGVRVNE